MAQVTSYKMFTNDQERIYQGLKDIGPQIANFYADAILLIDPACILASKANLIAHMAREIDGGLRDVYAPDELKSAKQKQLSGPDKGHFASILVALGREKEDPLANEWLSIATKFAGIAHRSGPHKPSKDTAEILQLWKRYERVLQQLLGSYFSVVDRLDSLLRLDRPTEEILEMLPNTLANPANANYFFTKLNKPEWIGPLSDRGFFELKTAPVSLQPNTFPEPWYALRSLVNIAKLQHDASQAQIAQIIDTIQEEFINSDLRLNPYTVHDMANLLVELQVYSFSPLNAAFFKKFILEGGGGAWNYFNTELIEQLPQKLINRNDHNGLKNFIQYLFDFHINTEEVIFDDSETIQTSTAVPIVEDFMLQQFVERYAMPISKVLRKESIKQVAIKLNKLAEIETYALSRVALPTIESTNQTLAMREWQQYYVEYIVKGAEVLNTEQVQSLVEEFLVSETEVLIRIAFHFLRVRFIELHLIFWSYIESTPLTTDLYVHEPFQLFKEHSAQFSDDQISQVIRWIEDLKVNFSGSPSEGEIQEARHYFVKRWLLSLNPGTDAGKALVAKKLEEATKNYPYTIDHPDVDSYFTASFGHDRPIADSEFTSKGVAEQARLVSEYRAGAKRDTSYQGLAEQLQEAVQADPEKYLLQLHLFVKVPFLFISRMISAFTHLLEKDVIKEYAPILNFIETVFLEENFKMDEDEKYDYRRDVIRQTADFIKAVILKRSSLSLNEGDFKRLENALLHLLAMPESMDNDDRINHDLHTHVLNSTQGRLLTTLLELAWQARKDLPSELTVRWPESIKAYFTSRLERSEIGDKDFSIILGEQLSLLLHLDKTWVEQHIRSIFPETNPVHLNFTLASSLSKYIRQSRDVYDLFTRNGLFDLVLTKYEDDPSVLDTICLYAINEWSFWDREPEEADSLIGTLMRAESEKVLMGILISILKSNRLNKEKTIAFWNTSLSIAEKNPPAYQTLVRALPRLLDSLGALTDETIALTKQSIPHFLKKDPEAYRLGRIISRLADTNLQSAGMLMFELMQQTELLLLTTSELTDFVRKLYANGQTDTANRICLFVGDTLKGIFLKGLFDKHHRFEAEG
ncbi:MAG: hypothetical protein EOP04_01745 [Proteobacteria bacterium]|nr:MAG: hypothetical protein EOP04_01745 [Pseudomonadota bacterium]